MRRSICLKGMAGLSAVHSLMSFGSGGMGATPESFQRSQDLLVELQGEVDDASVQARHWAEKTAAVQRKIDSSLSAIDRIAQVTSQSALNQLGGDLAAGGAGLPCDEAAALFLSTGGALGNGGSASIVLEIRGNIGVQQFTFASGTAQINIIAAINMFTKSIGVVAAQSVINPVRVELQSVEAGSAEFVGAKQFSGPPPIIFLDPTGGTGAFELKDFGEDGIVGDLDCDGSIGIADLLILLSAWGPCPDPPDPCPADFNGDGTVGILDLLALLANWT